MTPRAEPPRVATWLASLVLPDAERESILGDLEEAFGQRCAVSRARAVAWYWGQVLLFGMNAVMDGGTKLMEVRPMRIEVGARLMEVGTMRMELVQATRRLVRDWRFSASIVTVLGIGVGAALVAYSVVDRVLLRPLPYEEPERLGLVRVDLGSIQNHPGLAMAEVADLRTLDATFVGVESAAAEEVLTLGEDGRLEPVLAARVTPGMFELLGASPLVGRTFEEADGEDDRSVAVLSHGFWQRRFGGDPAAVGSTLRIDGDDVPVLGVMPGGFALHLGTGANVSADVEVWLPFRIDPDHRAFWGFRSVVRLSENTSFEAVNATLDALALRLLEEWPDAYGDARLRFVAHPLHEDLLRDARPAINTAVAGVLLLLLVSFANGASLMLGRQRAREANLAVRSALGAGRARLVGVVLGESFVLALASGVLGAGLAAFGVRALRALDAPGVARWGDLGLDARSIMAATLLAVCGAVATGLYPALRVSADSTRAPRGETLQRGSSATSVRRSLVGIQMALAFVLVFGAAVLGRSALRLARVDLGFDPSHALSLAVPTDDDRFETDEAEWAFHRELRSRLRRLPGVVEAGAASHLPLGGYAPTDAFSLPSADTLNWGSSLANYFAVTPGYLESIGVELRQGRSLEDLDMELARPVAVVDETLAAEHFPRESPLGRTIRAGWGLGDLEIVGVIRHPRVMDVRASVRPQIYVPYAVFGWGPLHYVVRSEGDPSALAASVRGEVDALGAGRAVFNVRTLDSYLMAATSSMRMTLTLIMVQAALTALLAALGLFTVIAYIAYQTRRDTAIRSALGATRPELLKLHLRGGATILLGAIPVGLALALAGSRLLASMVYGVSAADAWSLAAAAGVTAAVGMLATYLPARSAAKADPMEALRSD